MYQKKNNGGYEIDQKPSKLGLVQGLLQWQKNIVVAPDGNVHYFLTDLYLGSFVYFKIIKH